MNGNVSSKGLASNFSTTGTISARGFVYKSGSVSTSFVSGDTGVTLDQADTTNATGNFSEAVTGLSASSTYTYRAYATNAAGTTYGVNEQVTTASSAATRTMYSTTIGFPRPNSVCNQFEDNSAKYYSTSPPAVNTVVYTSSTGSGTLAAGYYGYADGQIASNRKITVGANGVITAHSNC